MFEQGFNHYLNGKWGSAKTSFEQCLNYNLNDGPTKTLIEAMRAHNYISPSSWKGFRELSEK